MDSQIHLSRDGAVLAVAFARPEKKNALTSAMYEALIGALADASGDDGVGAVLITGSGGSFCAGNDIGDFLAAARDPGTLPALRFVKALATFDIPLVAAVEGAAVGIGTTMLLHCDLAYAAPDATFRMPFVDLGLVPEAGSSLLVPRRFGMAKASEFLLLGEAFGADAALHLGLINAIVPAETLVAHARERARALAAKPRSAVAATRRLMRGDRAELLARIDEEAKAFGEALASSEAQAAFGAFMARPKAPRNA
jgi:enoyl-CoA hydratase/carnithine racemase